MILRPPILFLSLQITSNLHFLQSFAPPILPHQHQLQQHNTKSKNINPTQHPNQFTTSTKLFVATKTTTSSSNEINNDKNKVVNKGPDVKSPATKNRSKLRQLKDRMWVRETLEDLTAAEFAITLESLNSSKDSNNSPVDVEALVRKLNKRVEEMCTPRDLQACADVEEEMISIGENCYILQINSGLGSVVYTHDQRQALLTRTVATRNQILKLSQADLYIELQPTPKPIETDKNIEVRDVADLDDIRTQLQDSNKALDGSTLYKDETNKDPNTDLKVKLYVREDGTVDWDGALQDKAALKQFGSAVWARINGMDPQNLSDDEDDDNAMPSQQHGAPEGKVTAKIIETEAIKEMKRKLDSLTDQYQTMEKDHKALLISAVSEGSAVANINLATIDPSLRAKIRISDDSLKTKQLEVTIQSLNYELERIFTYLEGEMGNTFAKGYISLSDRLAVAEFGLLESQVDSINKQLLLYQNQTTTTTPVDEDVLGVVKGQMIDFKRRLGIDYYVTGLSLDSEAVQRFVSDFIVKGKEGVAFYVKGCQLLWNDSVFCTYLFGRAVQGYTLKPREVRTLRRTIRDVITFIPVVIILIIPITPIGHVLVFGAIQRFFPDFFPSCFTERRQNLLQLYESTEYSEITVQETAQQKLLRAMEALKIIAINGFEKVLSIDGSGVVEINGVKDDLNNTTNIAS